MDHAVIPARRPWRQAFGVPPSKSLHQRALALSTLCDRPPQLILSEGAAPPGEDVRRCAAACAALGSWQDGALGTSRASLELDLGEGGTAFRFMIALAALRPAGARTLIRGRPVLMKRPHAPLLRALARLGVAVKRRHSGAVRVLGGGLQAGQRLTVDASRSSQFASALLIAAPRSGGLTLDLPAPVASAAYLDLTVAMLRRFDVPVTHERGTGREPERISVGAAAPNAAALRIEPDASAAACWWAAAALAGGEACVPGIPSTSRQADTALWTTLTAMGAELLVDDEDDVHVRGTGSLHAPDLAVDLNRSPDLIFLVGVLAAAAEGTTEICGVAHTRGKESDRIAVLVRGLAALGAKARVEGDDRIVIEGGGLHGGRVDAGGDHRAAIAFGVLGLAVEGVVIAGAEVVAKSQPAFLQELAALTGDRRDPVADA